MRNHLSKGKACENFHCACKFQCRKLSVKIQGGKENLLVWQQGKYFFASLKKKPQGLQSIFEKREIHCQKYFWITGSDGLGSIHWCSDDSGELYWGQGKKEEGLGQGACKDGRYTYDTTFLEDHEEVVEIIQ